jgi:hypothetical protein
MVKPRIDLAPRARSSKAKRRSSLAERRQGALCGRFLPTGASSSPRRRPAPRLASRAATKCSCDPGSAVVHVLPSPGSKDNPLSAGPHHREGARRKRRSEQHSRLVSPLQSAPAASSSRPRRSTGISAVPAGKSRRPTFGRMTMAVVDELLCPLRVRVSPRDRNPKMASGAAEV